MKKTNWLRVFGVVTLMTMVVAATLGCQPKKEKKREPVGRGLRGAPAVDSMGRPIPVQPNNGVNNRWGAQQTEWGAITSTNGDQAFQQQVAGFVAPSINSIANPSIEETLGYVSGQSNQDTGIVFWGIVQRGANGAIDPSVSKIHIEVFDSNYGRAKADGSYVPQIIVHIGADQTGFVSAQGWFNQSQAQLMFTDQHGSVSLRGQIQGGMFVGQVFYTNAFTGGGEQLLGQFRVSAAGFFR
jgi:hypothetical protein